MNVTSSTWPASPRLSRVGVDHCHSTVPRDGRNRCRGVGSPAVLQLTGPNQKRLAREAFLDRVAQPMRIHGRVTQIGNTLLLETELSAISSRSFRRPPEHGR